MEVKTGTRLVLVLLGLLVAALGVYLVLLGLDLVSLPGFPGAVGIQAVAAAGALLLLLALVLLALVIKPAAPRPPDTVLQTSEYGEIRIALVAIENMVLRVVNQFHGVRDNGRRVVNTPDGLVVQVRLKVLPDLPLPALMGELQEKIKNYVEEITGFLVQEVKVTVENIILDQAPTKKAVRPL